MNRQKLALFVLLIVLAVAVVYAFVRFPRQQQVPSRANPAGKGAVLRNAPAPAPKQGIVADAGTLHLELLQRESLSAVGYRRDIFSPLFKEEQKLSTLKLPPPPPPLPKKAPGHVVAPVQAPPPPPPPPTPAQLDEAELGRIVFLGFLKKGGERTVFLSRGGEIFVVKKGGFVGSRFQVTDVTDEAITIKSLQADRQLVIPLMENRSLSTRGTSIRP